MADVAGILFAVVAAVGWGLYLVPMKLLKKVDATGYQATMSLGILASTVAAGLILGFSFDLVYLGLASGLIWGVGIFFFTKAVDLAGLAITSPIMVSGVMLLSFAWGTLFFQEQIASMPLALAGLALLVAGAFVVGRTHSTGRPKSVMAGILMAVVAGSIFGSYVPPLKMSGVAIEDTLFSMTVGILIATWAIFLIRRGRFDMASLRNSFATGVGWNVANIASLFAVASVGLAIALPVTQVGMILPVVIGALFFKEVDGRKELVKIILGASVLIVGATLLTLSTA